MSDVDPLAAEADSEEGFVGFFDPGGDEGFLKKVTIFGEDLGGGVCFFAPLGRWDVSSSGHDEAIEEFEIGFNFIGAAIAIWKDDGDAACLLDGGDVAVTTEAGDSDERGFGI